MIIELLLSYVASVVLLFIIYTLRGSFDGMGVGVRRHEWEKWAMRAAMSVLWPVQLITIVIDEIKRGRFNV